MKTRFLFSGNLVLVSLVIWKQTWLICLLSFLKCVRNLSWATKIRFLAANNSVNMIGTDANDYIQFIGSQSQRERNAEHAWAAVSGMERCVATLTTKDTVLILVLYSCIMAFMLLGIGVISSPTVRLVSVSETLCDVCTKNQACC